MILDALLQFSDAQAITAAAGSTNTVDLSAARNIGVGQDIYVVVNVEVAFTDSSSDSTLTVALEGDSTTSFTPDGSQQLFIIPALAPVGASYVAKVSPDFASNYRYARLSYTPNNGNLTTGTVSAYFTLDPQKYTSYADAITIS